MEKQERSSPPDQQKCSTPVEEPRPRTSLADRLLAFKERSKERSCSPAGEKEQPPSTEQGSAGERAIEALVYSCGQIDDILHCDILPALSDLQEIWDDRSLRGHQAEAGRSSRRRHGAEQQLPFSSPRGQATKDLPSGKRFCTATEADTPAPKKIQKGL